MNGYAWLGLAIVAEVIATSALKASDSFTQLLPSLVTAVGYGIAFWMLTLVVRTVPVGVAYAVWAGMGIVMRAEWDIARYLRSGRLVQVLRDYDTPPADIHAVYPQRHAATARVKAFVDFVAQHFNGSAPGI